MEIPRASKLRGLLSNSLFTDAAKLASGTAAGRLVLVAVMPLVTRLYSPADFALLAVYMALVNTIVVAACLRLEVAIPLAETDGQAADLLYMALLAGFVISILILIIALFAAQQTANLIGNPFIAPYIWLVGFGVFFGASYAALQYWATRARRFGSIGRTRVTQACVGATAMLGLGWLDVTPLGLLVGNMLTVGAGGARLALEAARNDVDRLRCVTWKRMVATLRRYRRYPLFSTPEALANVAGIQVPILLIAALSGEAAGQLFLAMQIMTAPMTLLGRSIGQVYMSRAPEELRHGRLARFTFAMMRRLFLIGVGPMALAAALAPWMFPLVFGANWTSAGAIVSWIAPWMLLQLVVSPVSMALYVTDRQALALGLQVFGLLLRIGAVAWAGGAMPTAIVETYAVSGAIFYLIYAGGVYFAVRRL